jgi:hypothetical protein
VKACVCPFGSSVERSALNFPRFFVFLYCALVSSANGGVFFLYFSSYYTNQCFWKDSRSSEMGRKG